MATTCALVAFKVRDPMGGRVAAGKSRDAALEPGTHRGAPNHTKGRAPASIRRYSWLRGRRPARDEPARESVASMKAVGWVEFSPFAVGSKSERVSGAYLRTDDGRRLVLRRLGGNPFHDPLIEAAKGKRISAARRPPRQHVPS